MPSYIFLTQEGFAQAPNLEGIENLQLLGIAIDETSKQAFQKILQENDWIKDSDYKEVICFELKSDRGEYFTIVR